MLYLFEIVGVITVGYLTITQVVLPLYYGLPLFPAVRGISRLERAVSDAKEDVVEARLAVDADRLQDEADAILEKE